MSPKLRGNLEALSLEIDASRDKRESTSVSNNNINKILLAIRDLQHERKAESTLHRTEYDLAINDWTLRLFQEPGYYKQYYYDLGPVVYINQLELLLEMDLRLTFKYKVAITMAKFCLSSLELTTINESIENLKASKKHLESLGEYFLNENEENLALLSQIEAKLQDKMRAGVVPERQQIITIASDLFELFDNKNSLEASMTATIMANGNKLITPAFALSGDLNLQVDAQSEKMLCYDSKLNL